MALDPKLLFVRMNARLSRETQLHLDHRHHHFRINKIIVLSISILLIVLAAFNIYFVRVLWQDLNGIVGNMDSMHANMRSVTDKMLTITGNVRQFEKDMEYMDSITKQTEGMSLMLPKVSGAMENMTGHIGSIETDMGHMSEGMTNIDQRFNHMATGVEYMRYNVREVSRPMGMMNPFMP